jgi:hypothetical protein
VLVVLGEMAYSTRPSYAAVTMTATSVSVRRASFWWNSAKDTVATEMESP